MNKVYFFIILVFLLACESKDGSKINKPEVAPIIPISEEDTSIIFESLDKAGNSTGPCVGCLAVEIDEYSLSMTFSPTNPTVENCNDFARYISNSDTILNFPEQNGQQVIWSLSKTQGGADPNCFPDSLDLYITRDSATKYNFFFSNNANEYTMEEQLN